MTGGFSYTVYDVSELSQAEVYGRVLADLGKEHEEIVLLTADLAKSTKTGVFFKAFPGRSFNFGIAEQNMVSASAGLATNGKLPFVSTMACFASMRTCEQVRTDIAYPNLNVKIVATHAGLSMGNGGTTHHATEDIAIMRSMANMTVIVPADSIETGKVVQAAVEKHRGPLYVRVGRGFEPMAYEDAGYEYEIGKAVRMREGKDAAIIACGVCVLQSLEAAEQLAETDGLDVGVINMHTIKPIDREAIIAAARETGCIVTAEEHNVIGGLGGAVAEVLAEEGIGIRFMRRGIPDVFSVIGYPEDLYARYGIDAEGIAGAVRETLKKV
ncbi:MAG: transketolase C-terminal domain-containing protein [bacterium]